MFMGDITLNKDLEALDERTSQRGWERPRVASARADTRAARKSCLAHGTMTSLRRIMVYDVISGLPNGTILKGMLAGKHAVRRPLVSRTVAIAAAPTNIEGGGCSASNAEKTRHKRECQTHYGDLCANNFSCASLRSRAKRELLRMKWHHDASGRDHKVKCRSSSIGVS